jgi:RHS repeat-associated protein
MSRLLRPALARVGLIVSIALSLVAALSSVFSVPRLSVWPLSLSSSRAAAQTAPAAPTGGFALHGGLGGQIDQRTGQFSISVPLTTVGGRGTAAVSVSLSWQQERAAGSVDRSGWGAGWSIGSSFVKVAGLQQVYPADGGSYLIDPTEPSGLQHYKLRDLTFSRATGILPRRTGAGQVSFSYKLAYDDGRTDYFDANGNLAARTDRFGNRTDITWRAQASNVWQPTSIIDSFGLATKFDYSTPGLVKVVSPERSDEVVATTTIAVSSTQGVQSVTDPVGNKTSFTYTPVSGVPKPLITGIIAATGARTAVTYQSPAYEPGLTVATSLKLTNAAGNALSPVQTFSLNPAGNNQHNFTGYPNHLPTATQPDALFASGDTAYTYTTALTLGATTTLSTYDALHRLIKRQISMPPAPGQTAIPAQTQQLTYPSQVQVPALLPANYEHPLQVSLTESAATSSTGLTASAPRTTTTTTSYDDHGRILSATDEVGTTTTTEYDNRFGMVTRQTTTGSDGSRAQMVNTLTADGANIATSTTSVGAGGEPPSARQTLSYEYNDDGQLKLRRLAWAPGAQPELDEPGGGPDEIVTTFERSTDLADGTQSITTTVAAGTPAAQPSTTTVDLVTLQPVSHTDAMGRTATMEYDAIGRQTTTTSSDGMVTTTAYTPTQTSVTTPDGRVTTTTVDLLGRTVKITDNVRNGVVVADPAARTLSAHAYSPDGTATTATDQAGRLTTTVLDAFGRTVSQGGPTGLTHLTAYDDGAAHTTVAAMLPEGSTQPKMSTATSYDDADRAIHAQTSYVTGSGTITDPTTAKAFDGLGQPITSTQNDLTVTTDRTGPGGMPASSTAAPQSPDEFPGEPMTAITTHDLTGAATSRTLHQGDQVSTAVTVDYDAAGNVVAATDPEGRTTTYTYTPDGQPLTKTGPSGTVTTHTYDPTSGLLSGITVTAPGQPTRTIAYTRVPAGQPGAGQVATVSDGTDTITYRYDIDGHRTSVSYPDGTATTVDYNDKGQLVTSTDVTGAVTTYVYDATDGSLKSATQRRGTTVLASVTYMYDPMSRIATTTRGNGTVTTNTYTDQNQLATQTTKDSGGRVIEAHRYTYDAHFNPATRTDTYPAGGSATAAGGTWTTIYNYDAYDRLLGSAVYTGPLTNGQPSGLPITATRYSVDLGGDVTATTRTTRLGGIRPITTRSTTTNTIDDSGRLTTRKTGSTTASQTFDDDGRVLTSPDGVATTYFTDGSPATTTLPDGTTTSYTLWPDGSRRSATITHPDGTTSTTTYHYGVDGIPVNDTTADASTPAGTATTASYLLTTGREARTLLAGTTLTGKITGTPAAPIDTGTGVGYYLRDRHTSVTGLVDDTGAVTATYAYNDYGTPARADGRPVNRGLFDGGRTNPYTYLGASPRGPLTDTATGLLAFADRTYDPQQGRFTSPDPVDAHNRYQAFNTNPITYLDLSGQITVTDIVLEAVFAVVMVATAVMTAGASIAAGGAILAAGEAGLELTTGVVVSLAANLGGTLGNLIGGVTSGLLAVNDSLNMAHASNDKVNGFLNDDGTRDTVVLINTVGSIFAGAAGIGAGLTDTATATLRAASDEAIADQAASLAMAPKLQDPNYVPPPGAYVPPPVPQEVPNAGQPQNLVPPGNGPPDVQPNPNPEVVNPDPPEPQNQWIGGVPPPNDPPPPLPNGVREVLPGPPVQIQPDQANLGGDPLLQVGVNGANAGDRVIEPQVNPEVPNLPNHDPILQNQAGPVGPPQEPGTQGPISTFENTNVIIIKSLRERGG